MDGKNARLRLVRLVHVAKREIGLSDDDYRAVLEGAAGKSSCAEMSVSELNEVLQAMKNLGFKVKKLETKEIEIGWDTSRKQMDYIKGMWVLVARDKSDRALYRFVKRIVGADHPRFMRSADSQKVIIALRKMMADAGLNPDRKEM